MFSKASSSCTCHRQQHPKCFQYRRWKRLWGKEGPWGFKPDKKKDSQESKTDTLGISKAFSNKRRQDKEKSVFEESAEGLVNRSDKARIKSCLPEILFEGTNANYV